MHRRRFLADAFKVSALSLVPISAEQVSGATVSRSSGRIISVQGELEPLSAGLILPHEHIMSLFGGEITPTGKGTYDREKLFAAVIPYLKGLRELGCRTIADCTTAYFGRAPVLLREISKATDINILTNTGYYGAVNDRYVPPHAYKSSPEELARMWVTEFEEGIGDTGIRPGFIKIGVDSGPLSEIDAKIVRAAALTHLETGLTVAAHTGDSVEAVSGQLEILAEEGVDNSAWIWVHAQKVASPEVLLQYAQRGLWIELDGINPETMDRDLKAILALKQEGLLGQVLLSHDGNSFRYGGRPPNPYSALFTHFIPYLQEKGFSKTEIRRLTEENPQRALSIKVRAS